MGDGFFIPESWVDRIDPDGTLRAKLAQELGEGSSVGGVMPYTSEVPIASVGGYVDDHGRFYIYMCPLCFQPLGKGGRCNSSIHQGPDDGNVGIASARSVDIAVMYFTEKAAMDTMKGLLRKHVRDLWYAGVSLRATLMSGTASKVALRERDADWNEAWDTVRETLGE